MKSPFEVYSTSKKVSILHIHVRLEELDGSLICFVFISCLRQPISMI